MVDPIGDVFDMVSLFTEVALSDPLSAILVTVGGLLTAIASVVFFAIAAGGIVDAILPESPNRAPAGRE